MKKIGNNDIIGERGVTAVRSLVLEMGFVFYETGGVEAGIDGFIEIRDKESGEVSNLILQVQCKATERKLPAESDTGFEWPCREKDIAYWRGGTAPVLLIVISLRDNLVYWKSIKDYFASDAVLASNKIVFNKPKDLLTKNSGPELMAVAQSIRPGAVAPPAYIQEQLYLNLLPVTQLPTTIYWAPTKYANNKEFGVALRKVDDRAPGEWIVKSKAILSLHDLDDDPWRQLCDTGAIEEFDASEWYQSDDPERQRDFVQILNRCLSGMVRKSLWFDKESRVYFFPARRGRNTIAYPYKSATSFTARKVVKKYTKKSKPHETSFFRHSAFQPRFAKFGGIWYLEVTPTYRFTRDGFESSLFASDNLKKIKEIENNAAVQGQFLMWQHFLCPKESADLLEPDYPFLEFGSIAPFQLERGVTDKLWAGQETDPTSPLLNLEGLDT